MTYKQIFEKWFNRIDFSCEWWKEVYSEKKIIELFIEEREYFKDLLLKAFLKGVEVGKQLPRRPLV